MTTRWCFNIILFAAGLGALLASCNSSPKGVASMTFVSTTMDSTGAPRYVDTMFRTMEIGDQYGKSDVITVVNCLKQSRMFIDSTFFHIEKNGDVSLYVGGITSRQSWYALPFASQQSGTLIIDTTFGHDTVHEVIAFSGAGTDTIRIKGKAFVTRKVQAQISTVASEHPSDFYITTMEFAPELGRFVRYDSKIRTDSLHHTFVHSKHEEAIDYSM